MYDIYHSRNFHRKTIGKIYNLFKTNLESFEIHHIINIDLYHTTK